MPYVEKQFEEEGRNFGLHHSGGNQDIFGDESFDPGGYHEPCLILTSKGWVGARYFFFVRGTQIFSSRDNVLAQNVL